MDHSPNLPGVHTNKYAHISKSRMEHKKRRTEFTVQAVTKRIRFCLDTSEVPSLPYALAAVGLLGPTGQDVLVRLNACAQESVALLPVYARAMPCIGLIVEKWHMPVVRRALAATPFLLEERKIATAALLDPTRTFLVDGHLNIRYTRSEPRLHPVVVYTMRDGFETEKSWRCLITLRNGRFYAHDLPPEGLSTEMLWLDGEGRPDQEKGFLKRILKVYEVVRSPRHSSPTDIGDIWSGIPVLDVVNALCS
jgi:hypothetical protein